jgi:hypothetical protein
MRIGELVHDVDAARHLVRREDAAGELADRIHVDVSGAIEDDRRDDLRRVLARQAHDGGIHDVRMLAQGVLHLGGRDVEAARDDELLDAVDDRTKPSSSIWTMSPVRNHPSTNTSSVASGLP